MEIPVVNESDELIGTKLREDVGPNDIYRVSALWVINSQGEHLLAQRSHTKLKNPGKWGPAVAGTVEVGETYDSNIIKETAEEIGVDITIEDIQLGPKTQRVSSIDRYFVQWYFMLMDKDIANFSLPGDEVAGLKWLTTKELNNMITNTEYVLPSVIESLPVLLAELAKIKKPHSL